jgi:predicted amino acid-binding ACT domain protein
MSDYDMSIHANPDAVAWAEFFMQTLKESNWTIEDINESLMHGWFANSMMAMHDHLKIQVEEKDKRIAELEDKIKVIPALRSRIEKQQGIIHALEDTLSKCERVIKVPDNKNTAHDYDLKA